MSQRLTSDRISVFSAGSAGYFPGSAYDWPRSVNGLVEPSLTPAVLGLAGDARCTSSRASARNAGNAHRGRGAADDGFCRGDEAVHARDFEPFAYFQANAVYNYHQ